MFKTFGFRQLLPYRHFTSARSSSAIGRITELIVFRSLLRSGNSKPVCKMTTFENYTQDLISNPTQPIGSGK